MSAGEAKAKALNIIEPFDPDKHDRTTFSCGIDQVDNFFKKTANKLSKVDNLRVWVMTDAKGGLIGFYATNAHSVDYQDLPQICADPAWSRPNPRRLHLDDRG